MIADKIKTLRESNNMTQADLARKLGITRSAVNAWEMGISVPTTQYVVELANLFHVSTDYLLSVSYEHAIDTTGLAKEDINIIYNLVNHLRDKQVKPKGSKK